MGFVGESLAQHAKRYGGIYGFKVFARQILDNEEFYPIGATGLAGSNHYHKGASLKDKIPAGMAESVPDLVVEVIFDGMIDIVSQLVLKWERFGPQHEIYPADDGARLALDTAALCTANYRLNSFYASEQSPIVKAMSNLLVENQKRVLKPGVAWSLPFGASARYSSDVSTMSKLVSQVSQDCKTDSLDEKAPLDSSAYRQSGAKCPRASLLALWSAMYEATVAMLPSVMEQTLAHPEVAEKIRKEVDSVLGREPIKIEHVSRLVYLTAVWRETLRLAPSVPRLCFTCNKDTTIAEGKYLIKSGTAVVILSQAVARDPAVWGEDADSFKPDRMLEGRFEALPSGTWIPFGKGPHESMIQQFALQQALVTLAVIFQRFDVSPVKSLGKRNQRNFRFCVTPRKDVFPLSLISSTRPAPSVEALSRGSAEGVPLYVYYGSNTGSCEGFAQTIVSRAARNGFRAVSDILDAVIEKIPEDGPVIIITASFEGKPLLYLIIFLYVYVLWRFPGEPADNAGRFVKALTDGTNQKDLENVSYAVFGAGNHEWRRTYQRIPSLIDSTLELRGAKRLLERGEGDAGGDSFAESFYDWEEKMWEVLAGQYGTKASEDLGAASTDVQFVGGSADRAVALRQPDAKIGLVIENKLLTAPGVPPKHHIEMKLPEGMTYQCGNYLAILPLNPLEYVQRALVRFKVSPEQQIVLNMTGPTTLPTGRPISVSEILLGFVEIGQFANKRNISTLLEYAKDPATRSDLEAMLANFKKGGKRPNSSMLVLLEKYPDIEIPLGVFIMSLPPMRLRQYTISSSPLWNPNHATLTVGVIVRGDFRGVGSNYLGSLRKGDQVLMAVRPSAKAFHPPADPTVPMMLFAAGSGLAPFRGFLQERAMQMKAGERIGKSVLFFGCRTPEDDYLYGHEELAEWSKLGVVDLRPAFSRSPERSEGSKYVQLRIWAEREMIHQYYDQGAKFYTCGGNQIAASIREAFIRILAERLDGDQVMAEELFRKIQFERYATPRFT
ncbi:hypothetical protein FRC09_014692 [Ceratobasidium sp. 395]|nr:hypothetical protein FRC09_014692 [Ceratobasidium sp. 395]